MRRLRDFGFQTLIIVKWKEGRVRHVRRCRWVRASKGEVGKDQVVLSGQGLLPHMVHFRTKRAEEAKTDEAPVFEGDAQGLCRHFRGS